ncbi:hypothetical protein LSG25_04280 [Paralcaligenes sp. KSB-10]|jgi:hypothetical protein|uniref:hypothetical protein n=1 Tax=Paralcaligenes sp. KSB-10 TaxID=2901142 RepID=UPI001E2FED46|nr:hypothetical protein [Paralcaligenes sp. KSB-10]UHL65126.1 hypothetical protein LSG25_04280 [Paralcaligenes sp. KSB-10]
MLLALLGPAGAQGIDELTSEQMSVRELMRLDTELALSQAKGRLRGQGKPMSASESSAALAHGGGLKLVAIYGVGKKLLAEVLVGSQPHIYMRGQALPVGVKAGTAAFMLRGITGSCVQLERQEESHTLCLHPSLWAGR